MNDFHPTRPALTCQAVYLLTGQGRCHACGEGTRLFALMALPPFEVPDDDEELAGEGGLMLSYIDQMPMPLAVQISAQTQDRWRSDYSRTARWGYWMNHCEACDAKQGDHFVHGPEGPFWPYTDAEMDAIGAVRLEGPWQFGEEVSISASLMSEWRDRKHGRARAESPPIGRRRR